MSMEELAERRGDNLYEMSLELRFGDQLLELDVPSGIWNPTPHGVELGRRLLELDFRGEHVLELGTGCGLHAILIARRGAARLTLTEIDDETLRNADHNLRKHGVDLPIDYRVADWVQVPGGPYDSLVTNPPFAKAGKHYRRYFIDTLILEAHKLVRPGGRLIFVQSSMADLPRTLRTMEEAGLGARIVGESDGPFRDYYFEDPQYRIEMAGVPGAYVIRDGEYYERLTVLEGTLPEPPQPA